ncbi:AAA ATPase domain-containing protein [Candidatus Magnetomoraceae bacterium gMMP-15]
MRKFFSYGSLDPSLNYYAPRKELIQRAYTQIMGENPEKGGHYITVWAPRQTGKTWAMQQILWGLQKDEQYDVLKINLEYLKAESDVDGIVESIADEIIERLNLKNIQIKKLKEFHTIFKKGIINKPLVLILDEFDALSEEAINQLAGVFRNIYLSRRDETDKKTSEKIYLLHGVALIGVRSVLGIENVKGSPFNVQRSLHIPNLCSDEVDGMFKWYEKESGQKVEQQVIDKLYEETQGHPGLVSWFGELLTEEFNKEPDKPITLKHFDYIYDIKSFSMPNNTILNLISKAKQEPYKGVLLELFNTSEKVEFAFDKVDLNFLYMNGIIDIEETMKGEYVKFASPYVQKRLFWRFSDDIFNYIGKLYKPFEDLSDTITDTDINIKNLMRRYEKHLHENREWLLDDAPRRQDLRIFEAVYHFNLYMYLYKFLTPEKAKVWPEFPTGNGKIDILIKYSDKIYGVELKSYTNKRGYNEAIKQAADYADQLKITEISLVFFVESIDEANRNKYEKEDMDDKTGVKVVTIFVRTGL